MAQRRLFQETTPTLICSLTPDPRYVRKEALNWLTKEELIDLIVYMESNAESSMRALTFFNTKIFTRKREAIEFQTVNQVAIAIDSIEDKEESPNSNKKRPRS